MKILMYAPVFPPQIGGPATQCAHLCRALSARGYEVIVVTVGERFEKRMEEGYVIYRYPWRYTGTGLDKAIRWAMFPFYFWSILRKNRPDIVHCHSVSVLSFVAAWLARWYKIPRIIKFAGDWVWETLSTNRLRAQDFDNIYQHSLLSRLLYSFERWGLSLFDVQWAPSQFRAQNIETILGNRDKVRIIPNALVLSGGGAHDLHDEDPLIVVSANRFIPHKRIPMIIHAFASLEDPRARLILIGSGKEKEIRAARDAADEADVTVQTTFTGKLQSDEVYEYFKKANVYVSASLEEGFPNVFIEAMHYGLPIIATDVGGCREMVVEGVTGFLVDPMDEEALAGRLQQLAHDHQLRNTMARAAFERSHLFDLSVVVQQFESLYRTLLEKKT